MPGESHGEKRLVGYSPRGHKESDTTERLHFHFLFLQEDRLFRMNQAAELFLIQIIEKGSLVGMVTFDSVAEIRNNLTKITDDNVYENITANLPQEANGGTSICRGLKAGFQVK